MDCSATQPKRNRNHCSRGWEVRDREAPSRAWSRRGTTLAADQAVAVPRIITLHTFLRGSASMSAQRRFAAQELQLQAAATHQPSVLC